MTINRNPEQERRREPRAYFIFVDYCLSEAPSLKIVTFAKSISASGMCILLVEDVKVNTILLLTVHLLDEEKSIEVKARVIWTRPSSFLRSKEMHHFEAGLEYVDINNEDQARILSHVVRTLPAK